MTTDRELLEAAYAAYRPGENYTRLVNDAGSDYWNPLADDGDALRLATVCRLTVCMDGYATVSASEQWRGGDPAAAFITQSVRECDDKHAATRRAIVRAAAEIGRSKT
jgi:hypothetical protein